MIATAAGLDARHTGVILVDDDVASAHDFGKRLERCGYVVCHASTGEEAAREMGREEATVALVVVDSALGNGMLGQPLAEVVLAARQVPVVALVSAAGEAAVVPRFICHGCATKDASTAVLEACLNAASRVFERERDARRRRLDLENAAVGAKLGLWEYDGLASRFAGSAVVHEILGFPAAGVLDLEAVSALHAPPSAALLERAIELALRKGAPFSLVSEIQTASGTRRSIRMQGQASSQPSGGSFRVFGTVQDLSDIRLLDRISQESELTLGQIEQISHVGHWSVSLADGSLFHSDEIKRIFGYEPSEYALSVEEAINAYHPDDRAEVIRLFNRAVETGEGYEFDLRIVQPSGDVRHVHSKGYAERDERGTVARVYGVFQDVTDRVRTERARRENEASMKALVDGVGTAIVVHGKNGEILLSNRMANRLLRPVAGDLVGKPLADPAWRFIAEDGQEVTLDQLPVSRLLKDRTPIENLVMGYHRGAEVAWVLVNGVPVFDDEGALSRIIISFVDITERKQMEAHLHQSEKMRAIGQLAGGVAHDFNNQLTAMLYYAELLVESLPKDSEERSWAAGIVSGATRSAELTRQLLAFARKGKYVVKPVDVNALIREVVSIASHSFNKKIRVTQHANAPATIPGDASQLQNALLNMALNARDAMPDGGELVFTTDHAMLDEQALRNVDLDGEPGEYLRITIRDTGIGMDASTRERVFEPFFTTKEQGAGTGMGMASVYGTVKNHFGAIDVQSEPAAGTTIALYFPFVRQEAPKSEVPVAAPAESAGRILVIDDEKGVASALTTMLRRKGYETTTCANGREGVQEFAKSWRSTDVVLLDMIMPEMNGAETFYALKAIDPQVKVVLTSGYSFSDEAKRIIDDGAAAFLEKPVALKQLLQVIANVIRVKRAGPD